MVGGSEQEDLVSAAILAAIIEEREKERSQKHCPTCTCSISPPSSKRSNERRKNEEDNRNFDAASEPSIASHSSIDFDSTRDFMRTFPAVSSHSGFDVRAINVGTQTLPSYIGQRGGNGVVSTCNNCSIFNKNRSFSTTSINSKSELDSSRKEAINNSNNNSYSHNLDRQKSFKDSSRIYQDQSAPTPNFTSWRRETNSIVDQQRNGTSISNSWDWQNTDNFLDSGIPSTPTSLSSCLTSPTDSPGHLKGNSCDFSSNGGDHSLVKGDNDRGNKWAQSSLTPRMNETQSLLNEENKFLQFSITPYEYLSCTEGGDDRKEHVPNIFKISQQMDPHELCHKSPFIDFNSRSLNDGKSSLGENFEGGISSSNAEFRSDSAPKYENCFPSNKKLSSKYKLKFGNDLMDHADLPTSIISLESDSLVSDITGGKDNFTSAQALENFLLNEEKIDEVLSDSQLNISSNSQQVNGCHFMGRSDVCSDSSTSQEPRNLMSSSDSTTTDGDSSRHPLLHFHYVPFETSV